MNAIGLVGTARTSLMGVTRALDNYTDEPQVISAAIAALFKLDGVGAQEKLLARDILDPRVVILSGLQTAEPKHIDTTGLAIDIETDSVLIQKLALVNLGLGRAPPRIFHPRHSNRAIVKLLSRDGEPVVSQYAVWATAENKELGSDDLGIDLNKISDHPINVQSYVYRLLAEEGSPDLSRHNTLMEGMEHDEPKIRMSTAIGLKDTFYDGLEVGVLDWYLSEAVPDVSDHVLDHIVRQASNSAGYRGIALEIYEASEQDLKKRERMRAMSFGTPLFSALESITISQDDGLFPLPIRGVIIVNDQRGSNFGTAQGNMAFSGDATNSGVINNNQIVSDPTAARTTLQNAAQDVQTMPISLELKEAIVRASDEAVTQPTQGRIQSVGRLLETAKQELQSTADIGDAVVRIAGHIALLLAFL